ncbi:MAG TPA: His/Gly/Thr/Pro-type tRNA ligase C-terminal domain-containing protein, partial [Prolixibacteraceae bacterium]|nr:His/Gly/Thr/Pro-type tRNA ligase C-terminal domain-containing protein [Prolixibacteraceae bacterium]
FDLGIAVELDLTLARGLNYYTGAIFEVKANDVQIGSITGGGRYDDLTGIFGLPGVSGVGISFGADRIYDVMEQLNLFPTEALAGAKVLFINFGKDEEAYVLPAVSRMRSVGISCEIYPEAAKMKKQMEYANRKQIPYVILAGETEISDGKLTLKNMLTGEQSLLSVDEIISLLAN